MKKWLVVLFVLVSCALVTLASLLGLAHSGSLKESDVCLHKSSSSPLINAPVFYQKLLEVTPQWMSEQIAHDLAPFHTELSRAFLDNFFAQEKLYLVRMRVVNGALSIEKSPSAASGLYNMFLLGKVVDISDLISAHILELHRLKALPDLDCVFTSCDHLPPAYEGSCLPANNALWPVFVMSKCSCDKGLILMPDWFSFAGYEPQKSLVIEGNALYPWESKIDTLFFRGADSGSWRSWETSPRPKLVQLSIAHPDLIDAKFHSLLPYRKESLELKLQNAKNQGWMGEYVSMRDHSRYRYLMEVDGHCASTPRLPLLLHSNSVILKNTTSSMLWFYRKLQPYQHFIPVAEDLSDLFVQLQWAKTHDEECRAIALNARQLAAEVLTPEITYLYLYRLLEEYSKKQRVVYN